MATVAAAPVPTSLGKTRNLIREKLVRCAQRYKVPLGGA